MSAKIFTLPRDPAHAAKPTTPGALPRGLFVYVPQLSMGGAELSMVSLAGGFAALGVCVTLVVHDERQHKIDVPAGVAVESLGTQRSLGAIWRLRRLLRARRPSALLTAFPHTNLVAVLARFLARVDCKLVVSEHAPLSRQVDHMGGWRYRLLPRLTRWAYPRADAVVAVSQGVRDDLKTWMPDLAPQVIYNPVLPSDWALRAAEPVPHAWLADGSLDVVLSVSRLSAEKDLPTLVHAFAMAAASRPTARLLIAGEGPARDAIERFIDQLGLQGVVELVGMVRNPLAWMARARVFALASQFEGFGNVLVEALAAGARVVSTDCPVGPREILQDGRFGRLVPVGDVQAMAAALGASLDAADAPDPARADAQEAARQFTQERACTAYLRLFADIEARRSGPAAR
ncbi:MAG: glycosyltransferase [Rhizobacter sp.]|nr:glycosyltransferase [Rhizobacter sp.]